MTRWATRSSSSRASSRSTSPPRHRPGRLRDRPGVRDGQSLYFCVPPQLQAPRLLGHRRRPAVQDPQLREHPRPGPADAAVRPAHRPGDAGQAPPPPGLDIGSVVSGLNQPISPVRTPLLIQKALELCAEVRSLGAGLLSAIEKGDAEHLARLRQNTRDHAAAADPERPVTCSGSKPRRRPRPCCAAAPRPLERYTFYLRRLGLTPDATTVPATFTVDHRPELTEDNFDDAYQTLVGKYDLTIPPQALPGTAARRSASPSAQSGASGTGSLYLNANEDAELNTHMPTARDAEPGSLSPRRHRSAPAPDPRRSSSTFTTGAWARTRRSSGATCLPTSVTTAAEILRMLAAWEQEQGAMAARTAGYQRRSRRLAAAGQPRRPRAQPARPPDPRLHASPSRRPAPSTHRQGPGGPGPGRAGLPANQVLQRRTVRLDARPAVRACTTSTTASPSTPPAKPRPP